MERVWERGKERKMEEWVSAERVWRGRRRTRSRVRGFFASGDQQEERFWSYKKMKYVNQRKRESDLEVVTAQ